MASAGQLDWKVFLLGSAGLLVAMFAASFWAQNDAAGQLLPHGFCFTWLPGLVALHVISNAMIAAAYLSIPFMLIYLVRKRTDLPFGRLFLLFSAFIVSCGLSHASEVWTIWNPDYWMSGMVKALTAAISVTAAVVLARNLPVALALPSSQALQAAHDALANEVSTRRQAETELRLAQAQLEQRVAERAHELDEANALLDALFRSAPIGMAVLDEDLRYLRINDAMARINGITEAAHMGHSLPELLPGLDESASDAVRQVFATREPVPAREVSGRTPASTEMRHWTIGAFPIEVPGRLLRVGVVCEEVTEKHRLETERRRLLAQSEHANRVKDQFLAMVSHELRTPLQATLSWVHLLKSRVEAAPEIGKAVERIERNVHLQAKIIGDLLDISRILSGKLRLEPKSVDAAQCVRSAIETVRPIADRNSVSVVMATPQTEDLVRVDPTRLEQVVWNLVNNAVQFTAPRGTVLVTISTARPDAAGAAPQWTLEVSDTGIGIDPADLPRLFEPFRQGQSGAVRGPRGLGLGLAISRSIVEQSGGRITVTSEGIGHGTTVRVTLPVVRDGEAWDTDDASAAGPTGSASLEGMHVLLVEDDRDVLEAMTEGLRQSGAAVTASASVHAALSVLARGEIDVLVCDLNLGSGGSGFEIAACIRRRPPDRPLIAIALSAYGREEDFAATAEAGFLAHLVKPVESDTVIRAIGRLRHAGQ